MDDCATVSCARNLEIEVKCNEEELKDLCARLDAHGIPVTVHLCHVYTYFHVRTGRLKLREVRNEHHPTSSKAELIAYVRPDEAASRWSTYQVTAIPLAEAATLIASLDATLGTRVRVVKRRALTFWGATRIHLDTVDELGTFVELETLVGTESDVVAATEHDRIVTALDIGRWRPISGSYSDLLPAPLAEQFAAPLHARHLDR